MPSPNVGNFVPFNEHHAIVSCTASVHWNAANAFDPDFQRQVRKATRNLQIAAAAPSYGVNITFDPIRIALGVNRALNPGAPPIGVDFVRSDDDGRETWRHRAFPNSLSVQTSDYIRWEPYLGEVKRFINALLPLYRPDTLASVKLEYIDRFVAPWSERAPTAWDVLAQASPYINSSIHDGASLWHSQVAERFALTNHVSRQREVRVETLDDIQSDGSNVRNISVLTSFHDFLTSGFVGGQDDMVKLIIESLEDQHLRLKGLLGEIVNHDAAKRIGLT